MAPPSKRLKRAKTALSATRVLNCNTPIITQDIHSFITTTLSPAYWSQYSEAEKRKLIDLFPVAYRKYHTDENGKLECPVTMEFLQSDPYVKAGMARFKRDVEAGCWEAKWQEQARTAIQERKEGKFDEYLKEHVEECFGEENAGDGPEEDEEQSESDWEREHKKQTVGEQYTVEKLLRPSRDGFMIEVKWKGYEETTWESRARLLEDVPDMVIAMDLQATSSAQSRSINVAGAAEHKPTDVTMK